MYCLGSVLMETKLQKLISLSISVCISINMDDSKKQQKVPCKAL